jgi:hypothetical protein
LYERVHYRQAERSAERFAQDRQAERFAERPLLRMIDGPKGLYVTHPPGAWRLAVLPPRYREAMRQHLPGLCSFAERGRLHGVPLKWLSRSLGARVCYEAATEASTRRMLYSTRGLAPPAYGSVTSLFPHSGFEGCVPGSENESFALLAVWMVLFHHHPPPPHQLSRGTYTCWYVVY